MPYSKKQLALFHIRCAQGDTKYCKLLARERKKGHLYEKGGPNDPNRKGK